MSLYPLVRPLFFALPPEVAHGLACFAAKVPPVQWAMKRQVRTYDSLSQTLWGLKFPAPVGLAAGFDKNGTEIDTAFAMGFGFTEIGGVTPKAQPGNPRPRLFRLSRDRAIINRMGFNNDGHQVIDSRLKRWRDRQPRPLSGPVGVNLGKNKDQRNPVIDYVMGAKTFSPHADFLVINVSSPNTPGLRALQGKGPLTDIVRAVRNARLAGPSGALPPLLLKLAPDVSDEDVADILDVARSEKLDGLVISNTTVDRPTTLRSTQSWEHGGLSGAPLAPRAQALLTDIYRATDGAVPLVGVGGISSAEDAYARIRAGASLIQLYSALIYEGPGLPRRIVDGLATCLERDGFSSISEAVGSSAKALGISS